jgi:hypothetical protein
MSEITRFLSICHSYKNNDFCFLFEKIKDNDNIYVRIRINKNKESITIQEAKDKGYSFVIISQETIYNFENLNYISINPNIISIKIFHNEKNIYENNSIKFFIVESIKDTVHSKISLKPD